MWKEGQTVVKKNKDRGKSIIELCARQFVCVWFVVFVSISTYFNDMFYEFYS